MQSLSTRDVRIVALGEANKTITRPVFLGTMEQPMVVQYQASDVIAIAKQYESYINNGV